MNFFERIIDFLSAEMQTPTNYGWFHLMFIAIVIGLTILICVFNKNASEKKFKTIVWISFALIFILEVYKQLVFSFDANSGWDYQWYAFPYQLCSTPLYLLPFVGALKPGKVRDSIMAFLSTFAFFGGLVVFIYPNNVFISTIGINIQTMIHHGLQIVLGIYFIVYNRKKLNLKYFASGIIVFGIMLAIAMILNLIVPQFITETFNMFYISPYFPCQLALLETIYANVPYILFLLIYIIGFTIAAFVMYLIFKLILNLVNKRKGKTND